MRPALLLATLALVAACGDDSGRSFALADGSEVLVDGDGNVSLLVDGRQLWALPRQVRPEVRTFDESYVAPLAIWEFSRADEQVFALTRLSGVERAGDAVVVRFSGPGQRAATLTIAPDARAGATRIELAATGPLDSLALPIRCDSEASFFGFGAQYNAGDQRGEEFPLWVSEQGITRTGQPFAFAGDDHTTYFPLPYFLDHRGFGLLFETSRRVEVDLCARDPDVAWIEVVDQRPIQMVVLHGPEPLDVIRQLGDRLGRPARPPDWALGLWIGAQGGSQAIDAVADDLEAAGIPATALWVQDWTGVRRNADGGFGVEYRWRVDPEHYPDLPAQVAALRDRGLRFLSYANSFVDPRLPDHFGEMDAAGLLIEDPEGQSYELVAPNGRSSLPDLTNPAARAYVKEALGAMVEDFGFDGWMSDFGEWLPLDAELADGTPAMDYHNRYPVEWQRLWREVMDDLRPGGDYAVFARSGHLGVHRHAQIYWIGDQETSFSPTDGLPTVIPAMVNLGISGIPFVTHDIAGFSSLDGPSSKELFLRWTELGAFTPTMRTHEGSERTENWSWDADAETTAHFRRFARIHAALLPEIAALADEAAATSAPLVRHLVLEYPDDARARSIDDQFLLGPDLLVAPVISEGATSRAVYLPEGAWFHLWTGDRYQGPAEIEIEAPIGQPPVFSRGADRPELRAID